MTERQQLDAELTAILPYLPGWKLDPTYANHTWCAVLIDGTGRGIHVSITQAKGRFYISGMWPSDSDHQQCRPDKCQHITIARSRPPEKVAAEIYAALPAVVHGRLCRAKRAHHVAQCRPQPPARSDRRTSRLVRAKGRARAQSNPNRIYVPGLAVEVHGGGTSVSIEMRFKSLKVAKAVLRAVVKAGGLTD